MKKEPIISVSGLRGIIGESLDPMLAVRFVAAFSQCIGNGPIVVTRDGRATGRMLANAIIGCLNALGRDVVDADIAATPTTGVLVRETEAAGGIQISASHNPAEYNGIKLFGDSGRVITADEGQKVIDKYHADQAEWVTFDRIGTTLTCEDSTKHHLALVLATVDVDAIRAKRYRVLLDSNHGAGSILGIRLLEALGCDVVALGNHPDGQFEHTPEPTAENLEGVRQHVTRAAAVVGFCQDPDADRLALIDESGVYIGEEYTLAITLKHALGSRPGPVVTNCATSKMSEEIAKSFGASFFLSAVGEANVTTEMIARKAVYGGEGNGGPIDPRVGFVRDSFVAMAQVLDAMATTGASISEMVASLPKFEIHKARVTVSREKIIPAFDLLEAKFDEAVASRQDGLRLDWSDRWLLVRASNTEPIVRLIAEAKDLSVAQQLCRDAAEVIDSVE